MKPFLIILLTLFYVSAKASINQAPAHGFHWYSVEDEDKEHRTPKRPVIAPKVSSPYERLMEVRKKTLNKLATALLEPSFEATHEYMKAQQAYAKNNQKFVSYWQQVLMVHPELDHSLNFPTDNAAIAVRNDTTNALTEKIVKEASQKYGLLFFYRGKSSISQKMIGHLLPFVHTSHFAMISVVTDGEVIPGLPNPKDIPLKAIQKTMKLEARYMPALFLVHLKTKKISPLSYGFVSLTELKQRLLDIATNYKRFSYEGLGE